MAVTENDMAKILIIDDESSICEILERIIKNEGYDALIARNGEEGLKMFREVGPDVVFLDFVMPGINGMQVLKEIKEQDKDTPVVMITAYADIDGAVDAMRAGAHDYLAKPFEHGDVSRIAKWSVSERRLRQRINRLSAPHQDLTSLFRQMGTSDIIGQLVSSVNRVAPSDFSVVILGETGVGKELVARSIHNNSQRSGKPFVAVDCGAIQESLLESELFGHERGSFTGAIAQKPGKFESARGGTLFLDEVSNMPLGSQAKLLRVLQEKTIQRVGGQKTIEVDVRILSASNQDLEQAVEDGSFRQDLFYRLNEFSIVVPSLRERKCDIPHLANRFLDSTNLELGKWVKGFAHEAMEVLMSYDWPGNVRELRSTIRRAALMTDDLITQKELDIVKAPEVKQDKGKALDKNQWDGLSLKEIVRKSTNALEREVLTRILNQTGGNKAKAARILKVDYKTIHTKIKQLGVLIQGGEREKEQ
jgi:DNA-binding NtrC family response regulator